MAKDDFMFDDLQSLFNSNPDSFNIIEEQIDIDLQMTYFKRSKLLKKHTFELPEIIAKLPLLSEADLRLEEKRDILIQLASFDDVEAFRAIEAFWKVAEGDIKPWASMAYRESKMNMESSLLDERQILISTGLGGKGHKLRYFLVFLHVDAIEYSEVQQKIVQNELTYILQSKNVEVESIVFDGKYARVFVLIPLNVQVKDVVVAAVKECNQYGDFIQQNFIITNVKVLDNTEIEEIIFTQQIEESIADSAEFEDFDDEDDEDE